MECLTRIFLSTEFACFVTGEINQVIEAIPGSVVPLAMFLNILLGLVSKHESEDREILVLVSEHETEGKKFSISSRNMRLKGRNSRSRLEA